SALHTEPVTLGECGPPTRHRRVPERHFDQPSERDFDRYGDRHESDPRVSLVRVAPARKLSLALDAATCERTRLRRRPRRTGGQVPARTRALRRLLAGTTRTRRLAGAYVPRILLFLFVLRQHDEARAPQRAEIDRLAASRLGQPRRRDRQQRRAHAAPIRGG